MGSCVPRAFFFFSASVIYLVSAVLLTVILIFVGCLMLASKWLETGTGFCSCGRSSYLDTVLWVCLVGDMDSLRAGEMWRCS